MSPARRWSPFSVVARAFIARALIGGVLIVGCGSSAPRSTSGASTSDVSTIVPPTSAAASSSSTGSVDSVDPVSTPTDAVGPPVIDSTVVDSSTVEELGWQPEDLGAFAADSVLSIVTKGETTTLVYPEDGNTFRSMTSVGGGPFSSHIVAVDGMTSLHHLRAVASPSGMLAIVSDNTTMVPRVLTSVDGVEWVETDVTGLDQPADIWLLTSTIDGVYAAGALRTGAHPSDGPFAPGMWRSADGVSWDSIVLPSGVGGEGGEQGAVTALTQGASGIVAAVDSAILRSTDNGATWTPATVTLPGGVELQAIAGVVSSGGAMVAIASTAGDLSDQRLVTLRSQDDGRTWTATVVADSGPGSIGAPGGTVFAAGDAFWIATRRSSDLFGDGDDCYRDLDRCARGSDAVLLRSTDGAGWDEVDLRELDDSGFLSILGVVDRPTGVLVIGAADGLRGWTWQDDGAPPLLDTTAPLSPIREPLADFDSTLTVGTVYRFPLYLHCGMGYLGDFNDTFWTLDPASAPLNPKTGAGDDPPRDWPVAQQMLFGYITLVEPGTIEYSLPSGEVIATFHPVDERPVLCK